MGRTGSKVSLNGRDIFFYFTDIFTWCFTSFFTDWFWEKSFKAFKCFGMCCLARAWTLFVSVFLYYQHSKTVVFFYLLVFQNTLYKIPALVSFVCNSWVPMAFKSLGPRHLMDASRLWMNDDFRCSFKAIWYSFEALSHTAEGKNINYYSNLKTSLTKMSNSELSVENICT